MKAVVLPPAHLRDARAATRRVASEIAGLLEEVADGLRTDIAYKEAEPAVLPG